MQGEWLLFVSMFYFFQNDSDIMGNMMLGPKFDLVARGTLRLQDVDDCVRTFDLQLEEAPEGSTSELPLFGHYCCRLAALPHCLVQSVVTGYLSLQVCVKQVTDIVRICKLCLICGNY